MIFPLNFKDFSTELNFLNLQNEFLSYDERNIGIVEEIQSIGGLGKYKKVEKKDFYIIYKTVELNEDYYDNIFFYKDFLTSKINSLAAIALNQIISRIKKDFMYKVLEKEKYINATIENIKKMGSEIFIATYLPENIKVSLMTQIEFLLEDLYVDDFLKNQYVYDKKIKLKMNKNDIISFFTLLNQEGLIKYPYVAELGNLIDDHFLYYDEKKDTYKEIHKSNKLLSDYKNGNKTIEKSINRLRNILTNEDFYILKKM